MRKKVKNQEKKRGENGKNKLTSLSPTGPHISFLGNNKQKSQPSQGPI